MRILNLTNNQFNYQNRYYKSPITFKGEFDDRMMEMRKSYNRLSWWWSGEDKSKAIIEQEMKKEIKDLELAYAKKQIEYDNLILSLKDLKNFHNETLLSKESELSILNRQKDNNYNTIKNLENSLCDMELAIQNLKESSSKYRNMLISQQNTIKELKQYNLEIKKTYEKQDLIERNKFNTKIKNVKDNRNNILENLANNIDSSIIKSNKINRLINTPKSNGFGLITGYTNEKTQIKTEFGHPVILEQQGKSVQVPNGILLYGKNSDFNKKFVEAIAKQYDCNLINVINTKSEITRLKNLKEAIAESKEIFKNSKKRTIIYINNFEKFAPINNKIIGPLKSIMDDISISSHATIIATSKNIKNLDDILLRDGRFSLKLLLENNINNFSKLKFKMLFKDILNKIYKFFCPV